ncbi:MAG TPA: RNA polymerase sigma factor [Ignavibacteria bacterium]|nr:RNA polymerase sigma factor [Ignavibacteria bacterium]HMQ99724.1 RNA polymerase sigma factor [Ignavibacteria bacterium]
MTHNSAVLLEKLKEGDNKALSLIYDTYYPSIERMVINNSGSRDDAQDIFQDSMITLVEKVKDPCFELTSSVNTYLYSISKNLWLKKLRSRKPDIYISDDELKNIKADDGELDAEQSPVASWLEKISTHCKSLIQKMFYENSTLDKIIAAFGYKNKHTAVNQKYKCLEQVRKASKKQ